MDCLNCNKEILINCKYCPECGELIQHSIIDENCKYGNPIISKKKKCIIPGFRTNKWYKMVISIFGYILFLYSLYFPFSDYGEIKDFLFCKNSLDLGLTVLNLFVLYATIFLFFSLSVDFLEIRSKILPKIFNKNIYTKIILYILSLSIVYGLLVFINVQIIQKYHTEEFKESKAAYFETYPKVETYAIAAGKELKNRLKNPESLQIHKIKYTIDTNQGSISFLFDVSAQNGFGGMNRDLYEIICNSESDITMYKSPSDSWISTLNNELNVNKIIKKIK